MNTKQMKILIGLGVGATLLLITVGNGCSKRNELASSSESAGTNTPTSTSTNEELINPNVKVVSLAYAKSFLDLVTSCVGVKVPSDATVRVYNDKKASLSSAGLTSSITGPQMMSSINIVAEVCNDLIQQEKLAAVPHIFVNWNLNTSGASTQAPQASDIRDAIQRIALSCWQKAPTQDEILALETLSSQDAPASPPTREVSALMICTAALSSVSTLIN